MPLYEYRCADCTTEFELLVAVAKADGNACPECGGPARRLISSFSAPRVRGGDGAAAGVPAGTGGGCCGGGCGHCG